MHLQRNPIRNSDKPRNVERQIVREPATCSDKTQREYPCHQPSTRAQRPRATAATSAAHFHKRPKTSTKIQQTQGNTKEQHTQCYRPQEAAHQRQPKATTQGGPGCGGYMQRGTPAGHNAGPETMRGPGVQTGRGSQGSPAPTTRQPQGRSMPDPATGQTHITALTTRQPQGATPHANA